MGACADAYAWIGRERNENILCGWDILAECLEPDGFREDVPDVWYFFYDGFQGTGATALEALNAFQAESTKFTITPQGVLQYDLKPIWEHPDFHDLRPRKSDANSIGGWSLPSSCGEVHLV